MPTVLRRAVVVLVPAALLTLLASPALAHVTVTSPDAAAGGYGKLVFRVPNESDTASTTKLEVTLPADTPFASVRTMAVPGWSARITTEELDEPVALGDLSLSEVVRTVTWTAQEGRGIGQDEFMEFSLSVGPFVDDAGATYEFAAVQSYDDGEVVAWDQSSDGQSEPELPAPTLRLDGSSSADETAAAVSEETSSAGDPTARILGGGGLALGVAALGLALSGRGRRQDAS
jgi:uncharacterized protein YcnI